MGVTIASTTVASKTVENDDDLLQDIAGRQQGGGVPSFAFTTFGTSPVVTTLRGGAGRFRTRITSGTGAGTAAANNITVTCSRPPRKVFMAVVGVVTPRFYVNNLTGNTFDIGSATNSVASTAYDFDIIVLF
jgi:hypothetical protein